MQTNSSLMFVKCGVCCEEDLSIANLSRTAKEHLVNSGDGQMQCNKLAKRADGDRQKLAVQLLFKSIVRVAMALCCIDVVFKSEPEHNRFRNLIGPDLKPTPRQAGSTH
jgi:hypothetical protein